MSPSSSIKSLGVTFDSSLTMSDHITSLCKSVNYILWNLSRIRRFIDHDAASNAMRALVLSKLDYAKLDYCAPTTPSKSGGSYCISGISSSFLIPTIKNASLATY